MRTKKTLLLALVCGLFCGSLLWAECAKCKAKRAELPTQALSVGDAFPHVTLLDQNGNPYDPAENPGQYVVLNMFFTRCQDPKMCPASMNRMKALQQQVHGAPVAFVSISFDPDYDTPEILKQYAQRLELDPVNYHLLTGDAELIKKLNHALGVWIAPSGETLIHSMSTVLINPQGTIEKIDHGADWNADAFAAAVLEG